MFARTGRGTDASAETDGNDDRHPEGISCPIGRRIGRHPFGRAKRRARGRLYRDGEPTRLRFRKPTLPDVLDLVRDGTALTLQADSKLRLCLPAGPLRALLTAAGLTTEGRQAGRRLGRIVCRPGLVAGPRRHRLAQSGLHDRGRALRPIIKVVNQS